MAKQIQCSREVTLLAMLENTISEHYTELGYGDDEILSAEHAAELARAVAWLASKYGD